MSIETTDLPTEEAAPGATTGTPEPAPATVGSTIAGLRAAFADGRTRSAAWRRRQLQGVIDLVERNEERLIEAMVADLGKPPFDAWLSDLLTTRDEARHAIKHLASWMEPTSHPVPMVAKPARAWTEPQPVGVVLIIAPWNYPVQLLLSPLVGALAAGNAVLLKPSELAPATSALLAELVPKHLDVDAVRVLEGGVEITTELLEQPWDHILFTGSTQVGKVVMAAAAEHLTPVTLELGGKSPTIVAADADLEVAAKRVAWAKFLNAGQTCIAPDYVLVDRTVEARFTELLVAELTRLRDEAPSAAIVNERHVDRLQGLLQDHGGEVLLAPTEPTADRVLSPVVVRQPDPSSALMSEEIFGPLLPVLAVDSVAEAMAFVNARPRPLALYLFSASRDTERTVLDGTIAGSVCVNHLVFQVAVPSLPFGGVGASGMGGYHGRAGFDTFTHHKSVLRRSTKGDLSAMYAPYPGSVQKVIRFASRWPSRRR